MENRKEGTLHRLLSRQPCECSPFLGIHPYSEQKSALTKQQQALQVLAEKEPEGGSPIREDSPPPSATISRSYRDPFSSYLT